MPIANLGAVVLDCPDPAALARFYAELVGGKVEDDGSGWVDLVADGRVTLAFQLAPDLVAPRWPDLERPQQFHLDVTVEDLDAAEEAVLALGATPLDTDRSRSFRVFADPAGHPFCLCAC